MTDTLIVLKQDTVAPRRSLARRIVQRIGVQNLSLVIAIVVLVAVIGVQNPLFFGLDNMRVIGQAVAISGLLAVVQTIVIILGALDISVGSLAGLCSVVSAMVFTAAGPMVGVAAAMLVGVICGVINGCIIVFGRVNSVIATLATLAAYRGVADLISNGSAQGYTGSDPFFIFISRGSLVGIPTLIWILILISALVYVFLRFTSWGRNVYAVGGNGVASRLAGININRYIVGVFVVTGLVASIAGVLITARTGSGQPVSGSAGLELQAVTAAALGGAALKGGKGSVIGTLLAVVLLGVLSNGLTLLNVNSFWQDVATGGVLVLAVVIQQLRSGERRIGLPS
ncbi:ABC transporter permease [Leifsonia sp. SIMBA_070]|uniref:ABC transporter permease n=2 Tax=Bacteria TaxID=2 RepID=UPI003979C8E8